MRRRRETPIEGLERGERVLATADGPSGTVAATTRRLVLPGGVSVPWTAVETATWDRDDAVLSVVEVPTAQGRGPRHRVFLEQPGRLVDVVREQVTASVVISRHVAVDGRRGVRVVGRRDADDAIVWSAQLDAGVDLNDPSTRARVDDAVALVRGEVE